MWKGLEGLLRLTVTRPAVFSNGAVLNLQPRPQGYSALQDCQVSFLKKANKFPGFEGGSIPF